MPSHHLFDHQQCFCHLIMNSPYSRALKSGSSSCFLTNGVFFNADFSGLFRGAIDTGKKMLIREEENFHP